MGKGSFPLILLAGAILTAHALYFDYVAEDAFISFRYAENLAQGHGLVWNLGERVEGYTNFLWVILLAAVARAGLDVVVAARLGGLALAIATIFLVERLSRRGRRRHFADSLPGLLLGLNGAFALWAGAGMETSLFTLLVTAGALAYLREDESGDRAGFAPVVLGLAALTRPEGYLFFAVALLHRVFTARARWTSHLIWALPFAALVVPHVLWRVYFYGDWLPNTFYAKTGANWRDLGRGFQYVQEYVWRYGAFIYALPLMLLLKPRVERRETYLLVTLSCYLAYVIAVGGDALVHHRFIVPVLPVFLVLAVWGGRHLLDVVDSHYSARAAKRPLRPRIVAAAFVALCLVSTVLPSVWGEPNKVLVDELVDLGRYLRDNVEGEVVIAVNAAGAVPYYTQWPAIDMLGLCDKHIARRRIPHMGSGPFGHEKRDGAYVLSRRPEWIVFGSVPVYRTPYEEMSREQVGGTAEWPSDEELWEMEAFHELYTPRSLCLPDDQYFNYFTRRGANRPLR
jgi:hypothetical protein